MKYSWFSAHVNVIRANVSSIVVTLVSDWFTYFYSNAAWISKKIAVLKKILDMLEILFFI